MQRELRDALRSILDLDSNKFDDGLSDEDLLYFAQVCILKQVKNIAKQTKPEDKKLWQRIKELEHAIVDGLATITVWEILKEILGLLS